VSSESAPSPLLVDLGSTLFVPKEIEPCRRWEEYAQVFLWDNGSLMAKADTPDGNWDAAELRMLSHMTQGQRIGYVLGTFDTEVCNGGVAQFLFNRGHLAEEALCACDKLKLTHLKALLTDVLASSDRKGLLEAQQVGAEEAAKSGDRSISPRAFEFYERERLAIEAAAQRLEHEYFPVYAGERLVAAEGPLRVAMCEALNAYVEAHPSEFQVVRAQ
jgi:hypothetical protein